MGKVEVRPLLVTAKGNSDNTFSNTKQSAKVGKTSDVIYRIETEVPATKVTEEELVHTKAVVNEETLSKTVFLEHSNEILIHKDILKGGISNVLHLEIDRKQGQDNSIRTEGNTSKLINDVGRPSAGNEKETNTAILGVRKKKIDDLSALSNNIENTGSVSSRKRGLQHGAKQMTVKSQDGVQIDPNQNSIVNSKHKTKTNDNVLKSSRHVKSVVMNSSTYNPSKLIGIFNKDKNKKGYTQSSIIYTGPDITKQGARIYRSVNKHDKNSERVPGISKQDKSSSDNFASFETSQHKSNFSNIHTTGMTTLGGVTTILGNTTALETTTFETTTAMATTTMETATTETTTVGTTSVGTTTLTTTKRAAKSLGTI